MNLDLLYIYIKANRISFLYYLFVAFAFLYGRLRLYPDYEVEMLAVSLVLLFIGAMFMIRQQTMYKEFLQKRSITPANIQNMTLKIALNKMGYMLPWLTIMFWPFHAPTFYDHLLGYIFVFCAIALYASTSSASFVLFLWDAGLQVAFAASITMLNTHVSSTYTFYVAAMLCLLFSFALLLGRKINQSSIELVKRKYQLEDAMTKVAEASRAKSDFLAIMSHEVRTPITGIMGMISFLKDTRLTAEQKECVETIDSCSSTLLNTLNDVLDVATIEAGKFIIEPVNFDFHKSIESVSRIIRTMAEEKNLALEIEIDKSVPRYIYADPNRIQQVLINLLNNAVKFTEKGSIRLKASYQETPVSRVRVEITDTGIGIEEQDQTKLFEKFTQIKTTINRKYEGTGLGLSIARSLVELMGGEIGVRSRVGEGTSFWIEIPYREPVTAEAHSEKREYEESYADLNVLLVEDNPVNIMVVEKILKERVNSLIVARDGESAVREAQRADFDMILMDLNLPDRDGIQTAEEIRALSEQHKKIPIIALTANTVQENITACYRAGMVGHIIKPYQSRDIYRAIHQHVRKAEADSPSATPQTNGTGAIDRLAIMREEFGPEYTSRYIQAGCENMSELFSELKRQSEQVKPDYKIIHQCAHDIKAVSGSLGMEGASQSAALIEKLCNQGQLENIPGLIADLGTFLNAEIERIGTITH
jgi:signal transduction histidine kinase/CheY-like chemotaxis protein/HPt (histidine-containing phosphotransfer) domain-containing protein